MKKKENTLLKKFYKILTVIILFLLLLAINFYKKNNLFNFFTIKESKEEKQVINDEYKLNHLFTKWGESLDKNNILQEYPRPQFVRNSYLN